VTLLGSIPAYHPQPLLASTGKSAPPEKVAPNFPVDAGLAAGGATHCPKGSHKCRRKMMQTIGDKQTVLFAQPYDISAEGFYFTSAEQYIAKAANNRNSLGLPVEEYEMQFIDGDELDAELFKAVGVDQSNFGALLVLCVIIS
jgi:hypothetical protein